MFNSVTFLILNIVFTLGVCDSTISDIFLQMFADSNSFNGTKFNEIYPTIKFNQKKWLSYSKSQNVTENCLVIKNLPTNETSIKIQKTDGIKTMNNFLYQKFLQYPCENVKIKTKGNKFSKTEVWIYGLLTVTFINTFAVLGILFMPLVKKKFYNSLMTFMVALAVGSLAGTAILILIPDSMKISEMAAHGGFNTHEYKWKATVVFAGLYFFFLTERLFKTIIYKNSNSTKEPKHGVDIDKSMSSSNNLRMESKDDSFKDANDINKSSDDKNANNSLIAVMAKRIDPVAWMIVFGDAIHNFVDGLSMGAAFSYDVMSGISVSVAIMCEEIPHELGDFAVLISSGMTFKEAIFWNSMSAMTCYLGFIIGVIVGEVTSASVWIFSIAGGMFLYISLVDMMNDIISTLDEMNCSRTKKIMTFALQNLGLWTGYSIILIVSLFGDQIQFGSS